MTFDQLAPGSAIFLDANTLVYHFSAHPKHGAACTRLIKRIENQDCHGYTSTHVLGDVVHRLMTIEAIARFTWPAAGIAARLRKHHAEIPKLASYQQVPSKISQLGIRILPLTEANDPGRARVLPSTRASRRRRAGHRRHAAARAVQLG